MVPSDPSPFYAIVFRGGDVRFLPTAVALEVMRNKAEGQITVAIEYPSPNVIDLTSVERIEPFPVWKDSHGIKLAGSNKRICAAGTVHDEGDGCECWRAGLLPMTLGAAKNILRRAEEYAALSDMEQALFDDQRGPWLAEMIDSGYVSRVASTHNLPLALPAQTHGTR